MSITRLGIYRKAKQYSVCTAHYLPSSITQVNKESLIDLSHTDALNILRQAQGTVSLVMRRDSKDESESPLDSPKGRTVVTLRKGLRGLGFELDRELAEQQGWSVLSQVGQCCPRLVSVVPGLSVLSQVGQCCPRLVSVVPGWRRLYCFPD